MSLDAAWAIRWVHRAAAVIAEHREDLTALDAAIGDGDHGTNLDRGLAAAAARVDELAAQPGALATPAAVFQCVATTLISTVGGAAGPLLGTAFIRASRTVDVPEINPAQVADFLRAAATAVELRGRAENGDKTMLDAWNPAAEAAAAAAAKGGDERAVLEAAARAAALGAADTTPLRAQKGRASYLGERSRGHTDPGAQSTALMLQAAVDALDATA